MELLNLAAIVSFNHVKSRNAIKVRKVSESPGKCVFELVEPVNAYSKSNVPPNPHEPASLFADSSDSDINESEMRNEFWKFYRSVGCHQLVHAFARLLFRLSSESGSKFHNLNHRGDKIVNLMVVNTSAFDVSDIIKSASEPVIQVPTLLLSTAQEQQSVRVPLYSTYQDKSDLIEAGLLVGIDLSETHKYSATAAAKDPEFNRLRGVVEGKAGLGIDKVVPHWWLCAVTESRKIVHIDLCGPAYDIFEYMDGIIDIDSGVSNGSAPVYVFECDEYVFGKSADEGEANEYGHKLFMTNMIWPNTIRALPSDIRHFRTVEKGFPLQFTPLETFLARANVDKEQLQFEDRLIDFIGNVYCMGRYLVPGTGIKVRNDGSSSSVVGRVISRLPSDSKRKVCISAKLQGHDEPVEVDCSKLSVSLFPPPTTRPYKSLETMHAEIDDAARYGFVRDDEVIIHGLKSDAGKAMNGLQATIIKLVAVKNPLFTESRWSVRLSKTGEVKSVAGKNLKLNHDFQDQDDNQIRSHIITAFKDDKEALAYLATDPSANEFRAQLRMGNAGFTTMADPKYRKAVKAYMKTGAFGSNSKSFEDVLAIAEHPRGEAFRQLVVRMKSSGIDPRELDDPDFQVFYEKLGRLGLLNIRR